MCVTVGRELSETPANIGLENRECNFVLDSGTVIWYTIADETEWSHAHTQTHKRRFAMADKAEIVHARYPDGSVVKLVVPKSSADVEMQRDVEAHLLALIAFAPVVQGRRRWSQFTNHTLRNLQRQYGDEILRTVLMGLLDDIRTGFKPMNPVGVFIHRVRASATTDELTV